MIEKVFADAKEKYAMRYTPYMDLDQVSIWVKLKFAAMNLIKYAKKGGLIFLLPPLFRFLPLLLLHFFIILEKRLLA